MIFYKLDLYNNLYNKNKTRVKIIKLRNVGTHLFHAFLNY